ncbi:MAG TPA: RagB/SusD family nutrient uptake outer membrane protein, partial [Chitinophagaceae bacterium]|nr:RagB/SusD family nutrient uptake outer membrane protein [Chitinophagaceae bacterium]
MRYSLIKRAFFLFIPVASALFVISSCKKMLDVQPEDVLTPENMYRNNFDADAAVIGIYGRYIRLAEQYTLLNDLRADLLEPTANADDNIIQLSNHTVRPDNPYASPKPFYELILSCNDALDNFKKMLAGKKFTEDEYNQRYSDIMTVRSWLYLQLGIHFGSVPYVVNPLAHIDDVRNTSQFERITFPSLLDSLVNAMKSIPFKEEYTSTSTLRTPIDGFPTH